MEEQFVKLLSLIQSIAPEVWRIALKQVELLMWRDLIVVIALPGIITRLLQVVRASLEKIGNEEFRCSDKDFDYIVVFVGVVVLLILVLAFLNSAMFLSDAAFNPEWKALQLIIETFNLK